MDNTNLCLNRKVDTVSLFSTMHLRMASQQIMFCLGQTSERKNKQPTKQKKNVSGLDETGNKKQTQK